MLEIRVPLRISSIVCLLWVSLFAATLRGQDRTARQYWIALRLQPQEEIVRQADEAARLQLELHGSRYQSVLERAWFWPQALEASYRE